MPDEVKLFSESPIPQPGPLLRDGEPVTVEELKQLCPYALWLFEEHPDFKDVSPGVMWMLPG